MVEHWTYTYSSPGYNMDMAASMIMGMDGNLYLAGFGGYGAFTRDIIAMSLTQSGAQRWYYNYNGPGSNFDNCHEITYGLDGYIYIAGTALASTDDFLILHLTRFGHERKPAYLYDGPAHNSDEAYAVACGGSDSLFTCGTTYNASSNEDFIIMGQDISFPATYPGEISASPSPLVIDYDGTRDLPDPSRPSCLRTITKGLSQAAIEPALTARMQHLAGDEFIPIIIRLSEQVDPAALEADALQVGRTARREWVCSQLKAVSQRSQKDILSYLETMACQDRAKDIVSLWIVNAVSAKVRKDVVYELANIAGVIAISLDSECFHASGEVPAGPRDGPAGREVVWGVQKIQANQVWSLGYTGRGVIVGILDTGVSWAHQDLNDHLWDGGTLYPAHGYDFVNRDNYPSDDHGHGTHVAGIVAGDGTAGSQTGVAPDARIMTIKVLNASGAGSLTWIIEGLQFAIDHGADIVNMSLGADSAGNATKDYCRDMCRIAYVADVPLTISAGNGKGGSNHYAIPYDITCPGDVPAPWFAPNGGHNAVISAGATDEADVIAGFSSYGPTQWNTNMYTDYTYPPGLKKPDVTAPGVNIISLLYNNMSGYTSMSGTSMAAPHLAGTIALMLEKNHFLTCREIDSLIENTALDLGAAGRDNYYGAGRINALNAVNAVVPSRWPSASLYIRNAPAAPGNLEFDMHLTWKAAWIKSVSVNSFVLVPGESTVVTVHVDTTGMPNNTTRYDTIWIYSNDPGMGNYPEPVWLVRGMIGVEDPTYPGARSEIEYNDAMLAIWPNPFSQRTAARIRMQIAHVPGAECQADVGPQGTLRIYDATGRLVRQWTGMAARSPIEIEWQGDDGNGRMLPPGIYFVRFQNGGFKTNGKVIMLK
jgi:serine protease AprX